MRDTHPAQPNVIAGLEGMHVVTIAGTHIRKLCPAGKPLVRHFDIPCPGEFDVVWRALDEFHRHSDPFGDCRVVGEVCSSGFVRAAMGCKDRMEWKALRSLCGE